MIQVRKNQSQKHVDHILQYNLILSILFKNFDFDLDSK